MTAPATKASLPPVGHHAPAGEIDEARAKDLDTSIRISADGLYFFARQGADLSSIYSATLPLLGEREEALPNLFFEHPFLAYGYRSLRLFVEGEGGYVLVPDGLRSAAEPEQWLSWGMDLSGRRTVQVPLAEEALSVVFAVDHATYSFCLRSFVAPHYDHLLRPLLSAALVYSRRHNPRVVLAALSPGAMDVVYASDGSLHLANRYPIHTATDALYYLTYIWRQFGLSGVEDHLLLFSGSQELSELLGLLTPSIEHIHVNHYPGMDTGVYSTLRQVPGLPPEFVLDILCGS